MKVALFPFNGELMCFVHVLLNALDMKERGYEVGIVIEGAATTLVPKLAEASNPMHGLYRQAREAGLIFGVCKACSAKLGVLDGVEAEGLPLLGDMKGHPSMAGYQEQGYQIITF